MFVIATSILLVIVNFVIVVYFIALECAHYTAHIHTLLVLTLSLSLSLGWDVEKGNMTGTGLNPQVLISLTCPKLCTRMFTGRHFLGLRIIPPKLAQKFGVTLPPYPGTDQIVDITQMDEKPL